MNKRSISTKKITSTNNRSRTSLQWMYAGEYIILLGKAPLYQTSWNVSTYLRLWHGYYTGPNLSTCIEREQH